MNPLSWKFVAQVIVIPLAWLVIWFVLVLIAHIFGFSVSDTGSLLSVIGGAMGAVFAVGGVIVALVSILTQIQLQDRVNLEVSKAKKAVEDKFEKEIRIEYEKRIQEQVKGSLAFFRATDAVNAGNWQQAEALTREALDNYPELQEARSSLAIRMSEQIQKGFSLLIPLGQTLPQYQPSFDIEVSNLNRYLLFETKSYAINSHGNLHIL